MAIKSLWNIGLFHCWRARLLLSLFMVKNVSSEYEIVSAMGVVRMLTNGCCVKTSLEMERYYWRAKELLIKNRKLLDVVVNKLIEKEILLSDGIQKLMMIE